MPVTRLLIVILEACTLAAGILFTGGAVVAQVRASDAQIVFQAQVTPNGAQEIFTMNLDGSKRTQITHDGLNKFLPHFSPDGTRLVYTKFLVGGYGTPNAQTDVFVYDFASGKETQLTSTRNSWQPVWSPDGQRIAYDTQGSSLRIMNADGSNDHLVGLPSGALDGNGWGDPAWSSDDWILFVVGQLTNGCFKTRLDKIRPDGTSRTKVTDGGPNCTPNGMEQSGDADPGFSADGKTIYSSRGFPLSPPGFPGQTVRRLYAFSSDAWTPGKIETDLSLPSAPSCIEGVPKGSPDGTRVLLFRACAGEAHSGVTLTERTGSYRTFIADGFGPDWNPVAIPTGTVRNGRVACFGSDGTGTSQIFTFAADGGDKKQLTTQGQNDYPSWTRDGSHILFSSGRTRGLSSEIWIMDPDGSNPKQITPGTPAGGEITPFASPDGKQVAFTRYGPVVGHPEIWVINVDGTNLRQLTTTSIPATGPITGSVHPTWSADGKKITYASSQSGSIQIWQMNADGSNQVQMTTGNGVNYPDSNVPDWSLDGKKITFWSGFETQYGEVWVMDADGQNKRKVTNTVAPRNSDNPHWSADGTQILFASNQGGEDRILYVVDAAGGAPRLFATGMLWGTWQPVLTTPASASTVSNAASYFSGFVAPGEIVLIQGSGLGPAQLTPFQVESSGSIGTQLAGTTVSFDGIPAPIIYTSATAVAAIVPYEISGASTQVAVTYQGQTLPATTINVRPSAPGLFTSDATGKGQAIAVNQDGSLNGLSHPAPAGSFVTFYATGEGQTSPPGIDGKPAQIPLPQPLLPVTVMIGGQTVTPQYAGGAPGEVAGVMQINARIPSGLQGIVPISINVGNATSQAAVTIAVGNSPITATTATPEKQNNLLLVGIGLSPGVHSTGPIYQVFYPVLRRIERVQLKKL